MAINVKGGPVNNKPNLAARAGRWSTQHRKKAIFGWLVFVVLAVFVGGSVGTNTLTDDNYGVGESGRLDKITGKAFPDEAEESRSSSRARTARGGRTPSSGPRLPT